jgi:hypothetical protein
MQRFWKLVSVTLVSVATMVVTSFATAPAQAETLDRVTAGHVQLTNSAVEPLAASNCVGFLSGSGFEVTPARLAACVLGTLPIASAVPACIAALVLTGVPLTVSARSCALAAIP